MRKYSEEDLNKLAIWPKEFPPEVIEKLRQGQGTRREEYWADKGIAKHNALLLRPLSSKEAFDLFVQSEPHEEEHRLINNMIVILRKTMERLGMVATDDFNRTLWIETVGAFRHLCLTCQLEFATCESDPKFGCDLNFGHLGEGEAHLADRVIQCATYIEKPAVMAGHK